MFDHLQPGDLVRICWNVATRYPRATYRVVSINDTVITVLDEAGNPREFDRNTGKCKDSNKLWLETIPDPWVAMGNLSAKSKTSSLFQR